MYDTSSLHIMLTLIFNLVFYSEFQMCKFCRQHKWNSLLMISIEQGSSKIWSTHSGTSALHQRWKLLISSLFSSPSLRRMLQSQWEVLPFKLGIILKVFLALDAIEAVISIQVQWLYCFWAYKDSCILNSCSYWIHILESC